jgi:hypothetical protein
MNVAELRWGPWNTILRLYGPLEPWFDKTWRPGEIELQPGLANTVHVAALGLALSRVCAWRGLEISAGHLEAEKSFPAFLEI